MKLHSPEGMNTQIVILGIDPGTLITGFGVIEKRGADRIYKTAGTIRTLPDDKLSLRLKKIFESIISVIDLYNPHHCCIETTFYHKNVQSALKLGQARGVVLLAAEMRQVAITEYSPREIKRAVTGNGAASKQQVHFMIKSLLKIREIPKGYDVSDALAIALCHAQHVDPIKSQSNDWSSFIKKNPERIKIRK